MALVMFASLALLCAFAPPEEPSFNGLKVSEWVAMSKDDPLPRKRRAALIALGQLVSEKTKDTILTAVARSMRSDSQAIVRLQAVLVLGQQPAETLAGYITDLSESLRQEKDAAVKREIATALGRLGKAAQAGVLPLIDALNDTARVKSAAADALGRIGSGANTASSALLPLVKDTDPEVRRAAVFALGRIEPADPDPAVAALISLLAELRSTHANVLVALSGGVAAQHRNCELTSTAVVSLGLLGVKSTDVVKALAAEYADPDAGVRQQVALSLAKLTVAAKGVETEMKAAIRNDSDPLVRMYTAHTFAVAFAGEPESVIPLFTERLKIEPEFEVRVTMIDELGAMGPAGAPAIPALKEAQRDKQVKVREAAALAIKRITKPSTPPKS